ncbi:MAG: cupin domain-containing protein [Planctomycetota bacterium]
MSIPPPESKSCIDGLAAAEVSERAALAAAGALPPDEAARFENHVEQCAVCRTELREFQDDIGSFAETLAEGAPAPSSDLKARLMARIGASQPASDEEDVQVWKRWGAIAGQPIQPGIQAIPSQDDWESIGAEGVSVRRLVVDESRRTVTMMIKMEAGSSYPSHRHATREECFVLKGDLRFDDEVFHAGDFLWCEPGSVHSVQWTKDGCELLLVSSLDDELLV